ncbi:MAG: WbuC family cupin fold metalloprotein [Xanthobacteraceae bacterium]
MRVVARQQTEVLLDSAEAAARQRAHLLLHRDHSDPVQRFLIGLQPQTYIRPHRHPAQWEMLVPLAGAARLFIFSPAADITNVTELAPGRTTLVEIPMNHWHTLIAVAERTLLLELKPGPFRPSEFAPWAPEESLPLSSELVRWLAGADIGESWHSR